MGAPPKYGCGGGIAAPSCGKTDPKISTYFADDLFMVLIRSVLGEDRSPSVQRRFQYWSKHSAMLKSLHLWRIRLGFEEHAH